MKHESDRDNVEPAAGTPSDKDALGEVDGSVRLGVVLGGGW